MFASNDSVRALYWFDPSCEEQVALGRPGFTPGALFTTDPFRAQAFASLLLVGESPEECADYVEELSVKLGG